MVKNWITVNRQDVLAAGVSDLVVSMPRHRLETLADMGAKSRPVEFAGTPYTMLAWSECERGSNFVKVLLGSL